MSLLVAQLTGRKSVHEDLPVPVGAPRSTSDRERGRDRRSVQRRSVAAYMLGMGEAEESDSIIPDDAQEIDGIAEPSGIKIDDKKVKKDKEAPEPDYPIVSGGGEDRLLSPRDALVAPDVTPQAMEPLDASDVPAAKVHPAGQVPRFVPRFVPPAQADPMNTLLGRAGTHPRPEMPAEHVMTAEAAQATVNTLLNVGGVSGEALLQSKVPMPDPVPGNASKIMEAFDRYGPRKTF